MSKSNAYEAEVLTAALTGAYLALYTADPGEAGSATTSEAAYTGYARLLSPSWTVTGGSATLDTDADFGECTASPGGTITHFGVVDTASGAGVLRYSGALSPTVAMAVGTIPRVKAGSTITED